MEHLTAPLPGAGRPPTGPGHYLRDFVYGATDGIVTTLAIVAAVSAAGFGAAVAIVLGIANLAADGLSMGASNYLALKSELEQTGRSVAQEKPLRHGAATFAAFVVAGSVPLLAFGLPAVPGASTFQLSAAMSGAALFAVGALRGRFIPRRGWVLGAEMLLVGGLAAAAAYVLGGLVEPLFQ